MAKKLSKDNKIEIMLMAKNLPDTYVKRTSWKKEVKEIVDPVDIRLNEVQKGMPDLLSGDFGMPMIISDQAEEVGKEEKVLVFRRYGYEKVSTEYHFNKMAKAYKREGQAGVSKYIEWLSEHNKNLNLLAAKNQQNANRSNDTGK
ncbi:MAG: hypothetical protein E6Q68_06000 [Polynucleobacter sp.]|nr:MAG: hypothetical protein E6Q68_06000 [Polynucleobacter sp.]